MTVTSDTHKSPVIAQAITQLIDQWFQKKYEEGDCDYYNRRGDDFTHVAIEEMSVDLNELGGYIAQNLGF